jgi:hypothetical protein
MGDTVGTKLGQRRKSVFMGLLFNASDILFLIYNACTISRQTERESGSRIPVIMGCAIPSMRNDGPTRGQEKPNTRNTRIPYGRRAAV